MANFFKSQLFYTPQYPTQSYKDKTVLVTGGNNGLGLEAIRHYVRLGASKVILACRTVSKGESAKEYVEREEKKTGIVEVWELNLSSYDSINAFVERTKTLKRLDVAVMNAGIAQGYWESIQGHEAHIAVNVIATYMLVLLLLPVLRNSYNVTKEKPYLTVVTSDMHFWSSLPQQSQPNIFEALDNQEQAKMGERYADSKLMQVLLLKHLTHAVIKDPAGYPVIINCMTPGLCKTTLMKGVGIGPQIFKNLLGRKLEVGSRTLVNATSIPSSFGAYIADDQAAPASTLVESEEGRVLAKRVWDELIPILEKEHAGISKGINV